MEEATEKGTKTWIFWVLINQNSEPKSRGWNQADSPSTVGLDPRHAGILGILKPKGHTSLVDYPILLIREAIETQGAGL